MWRGPPRWPRPNPPSRSLPSAALQYTLMRAWEHRGRGCRPPAGRRVPRRQPPPSSPSSSPGRLRRLPRRRPRPRIHGGHLPGGVLPRGGGLQRGRVRRARRRPALRGHDDRLHPRRHRRDPFPRVVAPGVDRGGGRGGDARVVRAGRSCARRRGRPARRRGPRRRRSDCAICAARCRCRDHCRVRRSARAGGADARRRGRAGCGRRRGLARARVCVGLRSVSRAQIARWERRMGRGRKGLAW